MRTVGIDLAASPEGTGTCVLEWDGVARLTHLELGADDAALATLARGADRVGIDCPVGWPDPFVAAVAAHAAGEPWPGRDALDPDDFRRSLRLRATDEAVAAATGLIPLSVSTDRIGVTAMRCALLLDQLARQGIDVARDGSGRVAEVYPAAALRRWDLAHRRYKSGVGAAGERAAIVDGLLAGAPWLRPGRHRRDLEEHHDLLDALVGAVVARAVALGRTAGPPEELEARVAREGWIHLPAPGALEGLAEG